MLNEKSRYPEENWKIISAYAQTVRRHGKASDCIGCKSCETHCPQKIEISRFMKLAAIKLG